MNKIEITKSFKVKRSTTLLTFLIEHLGTSRNNCKTILSNHLVMVNGYVITKHDYNLALEDEVKILKKRIDNQNNQKASGEPTNEEIDIPNINQNNVNATSTVSKPRNTNQNIVITSGNSTSSPIGESKDKSAYELNETQTVSKKINPDFKKYFLIIAIVIILLAIGYKRHKKEE